MVVSLLEGEVLKSTEEANWEGKMTLPWRKTIRHRSIELRRGRQFMLEGSKNKKGYGHTTISFFIYMVRPAGFEPAAYGFEEQELSLIHI